MSPDSKSTVGAAQHLPLVEAGVSSGAWVTSGPRGQSVPQGGGHFDVALRGTLSLALRWGTPWEGQRYDLAANCEVAAVHCSLCPK